jgi:hypothetical protein
MGRHSGPAGELTNPAPFDSVMIAGFTPSADQMHFLEPMVTRDVLLQQADFSLPVPMPQTFDRDTRYPTQFQAVFQGGAQHFIYSDFVDTRPATATAAKSAAPATKAVVAPPHEPIASAGSPFASLADDQNFDASVADDAADLLS